MDVLKNQKGATLVLLTILVLGAILSAIVAGATIVQNNIKINRGQSYAASAYFASEAGIEKVLYEIRKNSFDPMAVCDNNDYLNFSSSPPTCQASFVEENFSDSSYSVQYNEERYDSNLDYGTTTILTSLGRHKDIRRALQINYCVPDDCSKHVCEDNGCGETCPSDCLSIPGCKDTGTINNSSEVAGKTCCDSGQTCYTCDSGYHWDGSNCVED